MWCESCCGVVITVIGVIFLILILHYVYLLWNSDYWKKRGVFCPNPRALTGNLPGQVTGKRNICYDLDDLYKQHKDKFAYIGIFQFRHPRLLILDPVVIKDIMIKYFKNFQGTEFYGKIDRDSDPLFGSHPFFLVGDEWKTKRAEISPAFTNTRVSFLFLDNWLYRIEIYELIKLNEIFNQIKAIFPIFEDVSEKMIKYVKQEISKDGFDGLDAKDVSENIFLTFVLFIFVVLCNLCKFTIFLVGSSLHNFRRFQ